MKNTVIELSVKLVLGLIVVAMVYLGGYPSWLLLPAGALLGIVLTEAEHLLSDARAAADTRAQAEADAAEAGDPR